jgi:hypothetical protein
MKYNPFSRNFYRIRRVLVETCDLPRHAVRPSAKLAALIPHDQRRRVLDRLGCEKVNLDTITVVPGRWIMLGMAATVTWILASLFFWANCWFVLLGAILVPIAIGWTLSHFFAKDIEPTLTVGDAVLAMTSARECQEAGYRLSRNEIFLKVRLIVASNLGVNASEIKPETNFVEDLGVD